MEEPTAPALLKRFRKDRGLTVRDAGGLIIVEGEAASGATWHAWENGKKIPKPAWLFEIERVTGIQPNDFYPRPGRRREVVSSPQPALL